MIGPELLFGEGFLRQLERLAIAVRRPVAGHLRGHHRSRRTGSGMVFTDYRPYSPGDDTRNLDWNTYMRLDRLLLRLFEEEADLPIYILVDASRSMDFAGKFSFARRIAAALAYVGLINHDRVSVAAFSDVVAEELPARRGRQQVWRTLNFLQRLQAAGETNLVSALRRYFGSGRTRGLVLLVSDFLDRAGFEPAFQLLRQLRHEVCALHIVGRDDSEPDVDDEVLLVDAEDGTVTAANVTATLTEKYRQAFAHHGEQLAALCRAHGWAYVRAETSIELEPLILQALRGTGLLR
jgi:uncharacterized protein (DUF58 family)